MQIKAGAFGSHTNQPWPFQVEAGREQEGKGQHFSMQPLQLWASPEGCDGGATAWAEVGAPNTGHSKVQRIKCR